MIINEFKNNFTKSTDQAVKFGQEFISNRISNHVTYDIEFNSSHDKSHVGFDVYKIDDERIDCNLSFEEVVRRVYRDGKVPAWIDISIVKSGRRNTRLNLLCAGRYTDKIEDLYYVSQGTHPFGIKSPLLPPWVKKGDKYYLLYKRNIIHRFADKLRWKFYRYSKSFIKSRK